MSAALLSRFRCQFRKLFYHASRRIATPMCVSFSWSLRKITTTFLRLVGIFLVLRLVLLLRHKVIAQEICFRSSVQFDFSKATSKQDIFQLHWSDTSSFLNWINIFRYSILYSPLSIGCCYNVHFCCSHSSSFMSSTFNWIQSQGILFSLLINRWSVKCMKWNCFMIFFLKIVLVRRRHEASHKS